VETKLSRAASAHGDELHAVEMAVHRAGHLTTTPGRLWCSIFSPTGACRAAAHPEEVETGISKKYYAGKKGNPHGVTVRVLSINIEKDNPEADGRVHPADWTQFGVE